MIDLDDLRPVHAAQAAIGVLADRIEAALPEPEHEKSARWPRDVGREPIGDPPPDEDDEDDDEEDDDEDE